jgi:hypothetical protein
MREHAADPHDYPLRVKECSRRFEWSDFAQDIAIRSMADQVAEHAARFLGHQIRQLQHAPRSGTGPRCLGDTGRGGP